eukprot:915029_1
MFCFCNSGVEEDERRFEELETPQEKTVKIVIIGPSDSGKTTIIKQLKKIHCIIDDEIEDTRTMTNYIRDAIIANMKTLCSQSLVLNKFYKLPTSVHRSVEYLRDEILSQPSLTSDAAYKIAELWKDSGIKKTFAQQHYFQMDPNIEYFFNKVSEIAAPNYEPNFEDYIRIRRCSVGYSPIKFMKYIGTHGEYQFEIPDVGGTRTERRKWWNTKLLLDDNAKAIVYVVPLSDYDLTLYEDNKTNRLIESINLFKQIMIKGDFFKNKKIILFFNKYDLFTKKIKKTPITVCFKDFNENGKNPNDADDVMQFIAGKFLSVFGENNVQLNKRLRILRT